MLDPNRDIASSVWRAGPPTAILRVECGVLDPNRDSASSVWRAGSQPRYCVLSVACWTPERVVKEWSKLQGMLLVHENMIVRLSDVLAPHLGLVKDKMAMVVKVDLHHENQERLRHREAGFCHFVPEYMAKGIWVKLLKGKSSPMEEALLETWEGQFENASDHTDDAKTLFFVELMHADFKIDLKIGEENEKIEVIRWQFPLLHGMLRTAYSAQGLTLDGGVLVDLRRAGGLEDDDWWLAIYVMLTRARKLENLILLGMTDQVEDLLRRGPPAYLRELTDKLEAKGAATLERLQNWPVYESLKTSWYLTLHLDSTACRRSDLLE